MFPNGRFDVPMLFFYHELLDTAPSVGEICRRIIEGCGNKRVRLGSIDMQNTILTRFEERISKQRFHTTVMDSRSMSNKDPSSGIVLGELYGIQGLKCLPASGRDDKGAIDILREYFAPIDGAHPFYVGVDQRPKAFIFRSLTNLWRQVVYYQERKTRLSDQNRPEKASKKDDHLVDALKYLVQIPPRYFEGVWSFEEKDEFVEQKLTVTHRRRKFTGY
jgi:hypothetical protein